MTILDISVWQGAIPTSAFTAMKNAGITRVIHKAGGSNSGVYTDRQYVGNVTRARQAGLELGHYWFNGAGNPTTDANFFVDHLASYQPGDWLILDVENENSPHWTPAQALEFAKQVFARTGVKVAIYMSSSVTRENDWSAVVAYGCPLWPAQYGGSAPNIAYWSDWIAWQYTSSGTVPGIAGHVDLSHEGTAVAVASVGAPTAIPEPPKPTEDEAMQNIKIKENYAEFQVGWQALSHFSTTGASTLVRDVLSSTDEQHLITMNQAKILFDSLDIPVRYTDPKVLLKERPNGRWSLLADTYHALTKK